MEAWQKVWRDRIAPQLSAVELRALWYGLKEDDPAILQRVNCLPANIMMRNQEFPIGACSITYAGWKGNCLNTVERCEEFFARVCFNCDQAIGEPAGCRHFLNWHDETPREEMRVALLEEVERVLDERRGITEAVS